MSIDGLGQVEWRQIQKTGKGIVAGDLASRTTSFDASL
jgi:hypothetical protein